MTHSFLLSLLFSLFLFTPLNSQNVIIRGQATGVSFHPSAEEETRIVEPVELDTFFFLLGTLSDYMGRTDRPSQKNRIDHYYSSEKALYEFLQVHLEKIAGEPLSLDSVSANRQVLQSEQLAEQIRLFYKVVREGRSSKDGKEWERSTKSQLKEGIFKEKIQKQSFLLGAILRYGQPLAPDIYKLSLSNSVSTGKQVMTLLYELGVTQIYFDRKIDRIPVTTAIYFKVPNTMRPSLTAFKPLLSRMQQDKIDFYQEILGIRIDVYQSDLEDWLIQQWNP